jgi:hypothetical protein
LVFEQYRDRHGVNYSVLAKFEVQCLE